MSWSFYATDTADKVVALLAKYREEQKQLPDVREEAARRNALDLVGLLARSHNPAQVIRVESHGSMLKTNEDPERYSLKILVEPYPAV